MPLTVAEPRQLLLGCPASVLICSQRTASTHVYVCMYVHYMCVLIVSVCVCFYLCVCGCVYVDMCFVYVLNSQHHPLLFSRLHLLARGVGCFLHCQLPVDKEHKTQVRVTPSALGFVKDNDGLGGHHPTKAAEQSLKSLTNLTNNKSYSAFKEDITFICDFVGNPKNNLMSVLELFVHLTQSLFPSERRTFLAILCNKA